MTTLVIVLYWGYDQTWDGAREICLTEEISDYLFPILFPPLLSPALLFFIGTGRTQAYVHTLNLQETYKLLGDFFKEYVQILWMISKLADQKEILGLQIILQLTSARRTSHKLYNGVKLCFAKPEN